MSAMISSTNRRVHVVFGPPGAGKTVYAKRLAREIGGCLLDSDVTTERMVRAGLELTGKDPDDRHSSAYRTAFRDVVYETMFDLAVANLPSVPVVLAGPFTREAGDAGWPARLAMRLGEAAEFHFVWAPPEVRRARMISRGERRDQPKLENWSAYAATCREELPVFPHRFVDTA
jgi:predicted kinase